MRESAKTTYLAIGSVIAVIVLLAVLSQVNNPPSLKNATTREIALQGCIQHENISLHYHPTLSLVVNGEARPLPANIGVESDCMHPVHTHDESGKIHIEYTSPKDFTLGDFFAVWGQPFSQNELMELKADDTHRIRVTVNGEENQDYENLVMRDLDEIIVSYEEVVVSL